MKTMQVIPAIDLRGGCAFAFGREITTARRSLATIPRRWPRDWEAEGASRIHLVDLDGAKAGRPVNVEAGPAHRRAGLGSLPARRRRA